MSPWRYLSIPAQWHRPAMDNQSQSQNDTNTKGHYAPMNTNVNYSSPGNVGLHQSYDHSYNQTNFNEEFQNFSKVEPATLSG